MHDDEQQSSGGAPSLAPTTPAPSLALTTTTAPSLAATTTTAPSLAPTTTPAPSLAPIPALTADFRGGIREIFIHKAKVYAVAFDATATLMASAGADSRVKVWDPTKKHTGPTILANEWTSNGGYPLMELAIDRCCPRSLAFDPTGKFLAVNDRNRVVVFDVSDINTTKPSQVLKPHTSMVAAVAWHPHGKMLASGSGWRVWLWNVATGNVHHAFKGHTNRVRAVSVEPQGRYVASGSEDRTIRIWDVVSLTQVRTLKGHNTTVLSVEYSPDGTKLASGSWDKTVRVWRASDGSPLAVFSVGSAVNSVAWRKDSRYLVFGSLDGIMRIFDTRSEGGELVREWKGHSRFISSVAWGRNGKWVASGSFDEMVRISAVSGD